MDRWVVADKPNREFSIAVGGGVKCFTWSVFGELSVIEVLLWRKRIGSVSQLFHEL